jgi:hypothetical protein
MGKVNLDHSSFMKGLTESYLADLGRIVAAWSQVESQFDILYLSYVVMRGASSGSLSDPKVSKLMGLSFDRRIKNMRDRISELKLPKDSIDAVLKILDQLLTLRRERDVVAHSVWTPAIDENQQFSTTKGAALYKSWKNKNPYKSTVVEQNRLNEIFERIHSLFWELVDLSLNDELRNANRGNT